MRLRYGGSKRENYHAGANKAWATRKKNNWHRKTDFDKINELVPKIACHFRGEPLKIAVSQLTHHYRSKAKRREIIAAYEKLVKGLEAKNKK